jgi:hypothetical protein
LSAPLFRDPIHDGATDPVLVQNRADGTWWMFYTQRRAQAPGHGVAWVHGTDIGVAVSGDGGASFVYRGTLDLSIGWGRDTYWAPEVLWAAGEYHMYVSEIQGVPVRWAGHDRRIVHYVSLDLVAWRRVGPLELSSRRVIDPCVAHLPDQPDGTPRGWRMWFKDEAAGSHTYAADSPDLFTWQVVGPVVTDRPHEGPNVFTLGGWHWLVVDEWRGQGVYRSSDLTSWERDGLILDRPGSRLDDGGIGLHADVVVVGDVGYIVYFTHPGRTESQPLGPVTAAVDRPGSAAGDGPDLGPMDSPSERRSSIQAARVRVAGGHLVCDRDEDFVLTLPTTNPTPRGWSLS